MISKYIQRKCIAGILPSMHSKTHIAFTITSKMTKHWSVCMPWLREPVSGKSLWALVSFARHEIKSQKFPSSTPCNTYTHSRCWSNCSFQQAISTLRWIKPTFTLAVNNQATCTTFGVRTLLPMHWEKGEQLYKSAIQNSSPLIPSPTVSLKINTHLFAGNSLLVNRHHAESLILPRGDLSTCNTPHEEA